MQMRFLVIADVHGNIDALERLGGEFKKADAVIFAGDFAQFLEVETGLPTLEALCKKHDTIFSVIGNNDDPSMLQEIEARDISVEGSLVSHEGLVFAGSGGSSRFNGRTPFERTEEELLSDLSIISGQGEAEWNNLILILHNPPKDTECDKIASGAHVGSEGFRTFIEKYKPLAVITGHIHESAAIDKIGSTTVINPGPLLEGKYAWLEVRCTQEGWKVESATLEHLA